MRGEMTAVISTATSRILRERKEGDEDRRVRLGFIDAIGRKSVASVLAAL